MEGTIQFNQNPGMFLGQDEYETASTWDEDASIEAFCQEVKRRLQERFPDASIEYETNNQQDNWIKTDPREWASEVAEIQEEVFDDGAWLVLATPQAGTPPAPPERGK